MIARDLETVFATLLDTVRCAQMKLGDGGPDETGHWLAAFEQDPAAALAGLADRARQLVARL